MKKIKKISTLLFSGLLVFGLTACNKTAEPTKETTPDKTESLTLAEVFQKTTKASDSTTSMSMKADIFQTLLEPTTKTEMKTASKMEANIVKKPLSMHMTMNMKLEGIPNQAPTDVKIDTYLTKDNFFMKSPPADKWVKLPTDMYKQMLSSSEKQTNPAAQLKELEPFKDDFKFTQDNTSYILTLNGVGEKFEKLIKEQMDKTMTDSGLPAGTSAKVKKADYILYIDKKTFNLTKMDTTMDLSVTAGGQEIAIQQQMKATFSDYNKIDKIEIPADIIKNAVETNVQN